MIKHLLATISLLGAFALGVVTPALVDRRPVFELAAARADAPDAGVPTTTVTTEVPPGAGPVKVTLETPPASGDLPDPQLDPPGFWEALSLWWVAGGKVPAVLVVVLGLMKVLPRWVGWFAVGWRRAAVTLGVVLASTLLDTWLSAGAAGNLWMWLLGGIGAAISYLAAPRVPPPAAPAAGAR